MNADKRVFIYLWVKPYVYKYFVRNNSPKNCSVEGAVKLSHDDEAYKFLRNRLKKPSLQYEKRYANRVLVQRSKRMAIQITDWDWMVQGTQLSQTDEAELQRILECRIQSMMLIWVGMHYMFSDKLKVLCLEWLEKNHMDENDWSVDSMVRMCNRVGISQIKKEMKVFLNQKIDDLFTRTITQRMYSRTTKKYKKDEM